ncbi:hypothetical protein SAMN04488516_11824 [Desulfonauticus submarinus]|uniref:Uncharacterized protein n=1 Tax=Desulfonauticus submarinus TaxID=206665 RepID=A0A1H0GGU0_9BACT|nr:hypothetical protein [Desulfonauticus submarinus]SDO06127.1 hypothetical protein SAMN04488516_11824 [Desulfonauticus submarinus]
MQKIPINLAQAGMVLEKPVTLETGQVLLAAGATLNENIIRIIESKGIKYITVKGTPLDLDGIASSPSYTKRIERLDYLFRYYKDDQFMQKIKKLIQNYFKQKAALEQQASKGEE